jgi:conjugal transfer pilin signal peptidase TrbI
VALLLLAAFVGAWLPSKISVTLTPSVTPRVFWLLDPGNVRHGDYVLFDLESSLIGSLENISLPQGVTDGTLVKVIKRVGCEAGEDLRVENLDYYCGEEFLGRGKEMTLHGAPISVFVFNGAVPEGQVFVIGDHPDSYDSRYFGFVPRASFKARAFPLF